MQTLFDIYDATGGLTVGDTEVVVAYDTVTFMETGVSLSSGEMSVVLSSTVLKPPAYYTMMLFAKVSTNLTSGQDRTQPKMWIEIDTGSGYEAVPGSAGYIYNRNTAAGYGTVNLSATLTIEKTAGKVIKTRVMAQRVAGSSTIQTVADACNFIGFMDL